MNWNLLVRFQSFFSISDVNSTLEALLAENCSDSEDIDTVDVDNNKNGDDDDEIDNGPTVQAHVELAQTVREFILLIHGICSKVVLSEHKCNLADLAGEINQPRLPEHIRRFLYDQLYPDSHLTSADVSLNACPIFSGIVSVFSSAVATYHAPSDPSGIGGMRRERIRAVPSWRLGAARYDCAFVDSRPDLQGMCGLDVVRILLLFSFTFENVTYPCALVHWFTLVEEEPDSDTGMWMVQPEITDDGLPVLSVIHLDCIFRAAHLLPIYGDNPIPITITPDNSLDAFAAFYVNKYADHHAFEIAS